MHPSSRIGLLAWPALVLGIGLSLTAGASPEPCMLLADEAASDVMMWVFDQAEPADYVTLPEAGLVPVDDTYTRVVALNQAIRALNPVPAAVEEKPAPAAMQERFTRLAGELEMVRTSAPDFSAPVWDATAALSQEAPESKPTLPPAEEPVVFQTVDADEVVMTEAPVVVAQAAAAEPAPALPSADTKKAAPQSKIESKPVASGIDPLYQLVNVDFRDMELTQVVALLAEKAGINVVAGVEVTGMVTARLTNVPLRQAMETALQLNGLGLLEDNGIFRILSYEEVQAAGNVRRVIHLNEARADDVKKTLDDVILGSQDGSRMTISANESTNVVILSGPVEMVTELEGMAKELDITEPALPTITEAIKLNYADPADVVAALQSSLMAKTEAGTKDGRRSVEGQVAADERGRHVIITDIPVRVEQARKLIETLDVPVQQVQIEALIVDALLSDDAKTGVDWLMEAVRHQSYSNIQQGNTTAPYESSLQKMVLDSGLADPLSAGQLSFQLLTDDLKITSLISAEVTNQNAKLLASPSVVTVENKAAKIIIAREEPYNKMTQSLTGPPVSNIEFKEIGTVLEVTPRVTHDDHILVDISAKQSTADTTPNALGVPVEIKREAETSLRMADGQTIYIGGLRQFNDNKSVRKVPVLGDVPVMNFLFRSNKIEQDCTELMIFLTCRSLSDELPRLSPELQEKYNEYNNIPLTPKADKEVVKSIIKPNQMRDPIWRRGR